MVGVSGTAGTHGACKVSGHNCVDGGSADTYFGIRIFGIKTAWPHKAVLAAGRVRPNGTGLHIGRPIKSGFYTIPASLFKHLSSCIAGRYSFNIDLLFSLSGDNFFFSHL